MDDIPDVEFDDELLDIGDNDVNSFDADSLDVDLESPLSITVTYPNVTVVKAISTYVNTGTLNNDVFKYPSTVDWYEPKYAEIRLDIIYKPQNKTLYKTI